MSASRPDPKSLGVDAGYVAARSVLLDALIALASQTSAVIVAGTQAVYLHTGSGDLAVAPYTTDGATSPSIRKNSTMPRSSK